MGGTEVFGPDEMRRVGSKDFNPGWSLDTTFENTTDRPIAVYVTISITAGSGDGGQCELRVGSSSPPPTANKAGTARLTRSGLSGGTVVKESQLTAIIDPGEFWRLVTTALSGSPTISLADQMKDTR